VQLLPLIPRPAQPNPAAWRTTLDGRRAWPGGRAGPTSRTVTTPRPLELASGVLRNGGANRPGLTCLNRRPPRRLSLPIPTCLS